MGGGGGDTREVKAVTCAIRTAHLMAISGLHIAFAALLAAGLIRSGQFFCRSGGFVGERIAGRHSFAARYVMHGFTDYRLRCARWRHYRRLGRIKIKRTTVGGWQVWCCCLAAIISPICGGYITESLWLSAFAVAGLLFWYQWFPAPNGNFPRGFTLVA
ncbi:ComEC/Rec2 family competence protein [Salmonella enterica subsp. enterica serovar Weltevreden]|nr:ComEC/Rec2 family competence protein [Salmonella enterica subsp. enterica serovar Weltevreden]